jgi:CheY-like chemotaxis protein
LSKQHVLLVERDPKTRRLLQVSLEQAGFAVTSAQDGADALGKLELQTPSLVIAATELPRVDGYALVRRMKEHSEWARLPVIFMVSGEHIEDRIRGLELGVEEYLAKPVFVKELLARVQVLLAKRLRNHVSESAGRTRVEGRLDDLPPVDLLESLEAAGKTGVLRLRSGNREGAVYFQDGEIVDAQLKSLRGEEVVFRLLGWTDGTFTVDPLDEEVERVVEAGTRQLIEAGLRHAADFNRLREQLPPLGTVLEVDRQRLIPRLKDIPAELNGMLELFNGTRTLLDVIDESPFDDLSTLSTAAKLYAERVLFAHGEAEPPKSTHIKTDPYPGGSPLPAVGPEPEQDNESHPYLEPVREVDDTAVTMRPPDKRRTPMMPPARMERFEPPLGVALPELRPPAVPSSRSVPTEPAVEAERTTALMDEPETARVGDSAPPLATRIDPPQRIPPPPATPRPPPPPAAKQDLSATRVVGTPRDATASEASTTWEVARATIPLKEPPRPPPEAPPPVTPMFGGHGRSEPPPSESEPPPPSEPPASEPPPPRRREPPPPRSASRSEPPPPRSEPPVASEPPPRSDRPLAALREDSDRGPSSAPPVLTRSAASFAETVPSDSAEKLIAAAKAASLSSRPPPRRGNRSDPPASGSQELGSSGVSAGFFASASENEHQPEHFDDIQPSEKEPVYLTEEQVARKARGKRLVATVVGVGAAMLMFVAMTRLFPRETEVSARTTATATGPATSAPTATGTVTEGSDDTTPPPVPTATATATATASVEPSEQPPPEQPPPSDLPLTVAFAPGEAPPESADPGADAARANNAGRHKDAILFAKAAIAKDPTNAFGYFHLAVAYESLGKNAERNEVYGVCAERATTGQYLSYCKMYAPKKK